MFVTRMNFITEEQVQRSGNGERKRALVTGSISTLRQKSPDWMERL
jgi:hypothetical protein